MFIYEIFDFIINLLMREKIDSNDLIIEGKKLIVEVLKLWVNLSFIFFFIREIINVYYIFNF